MKRWCMLLNVFRYADPFGVRATPQFPGLADSPFMFAAASPAAAAAAAAAGGEDLVDLQDVTVAGSPLPARKRLRLAGAAHSGSSCIAHTVEA